MAFDMQGHVEAVLDVKLDPEYFASNEDQVSADILRDPYGYMDRIREQHGSVVSLEAGVLGGIDFANIWHQNRSRPSFLALGYDTVADCFGDSERFAHAHHGEPVFGDAPLSHEPPRSTPYKALVMQALGRPRVEQLDREIMRPAAEILANRLVAKGKGDLVLEYTGVLPFIVISALFDLPAEWSAKFIKQAHDIVVMGVNPDAAYVAIGQQRFAFTHMLYERRENPGNDLISWLAQAKLPNGDQLRTTEIIGLTHMLSAAGTETTTRVLGQMMIALQRDRSQWEMLVADRNLVPAAVGEALRWDGPVPIIPREARKDTELGGVPVPKGSLIYCCVAPANRDPARWPDRPAEYDLTRDAMPDLSFGGGAHRCVGNILARREIETALHVLLEKVPDLRFDPHEPPPEVLGLSVRSVRSLPYVLERNGAKARSFEAAAAS